MKHDINKLETIYDELRQTNPQAAANLGVIMDRLEEDLGLSPDQSKTISLYL